MPSDIVYPGYDFAAASFETILGVTGHPFGSPAGETRGVSDGVAGVQWNVYVNKVSGDAWLGVNLEGMEYDGWPITTFIEHELRDSKLLPLASTLRDASNIWVGFYRDAWQFQARPPIQERLISIPEVRLSELTAAKWQEILEEAYTCLHPAKNHRGRVKQSVTLTKDGTVKPM